MFISESKNDKQQNRGKRGLQHLPQPPPAPPTLPACKKEKQLQSSHHKVMLTKETMPKLNSCIIPWFNINTD